MCYLKVGGHVGMQRKGTRAVKWEQKEMEKEKEKKVESGK